jgi:hypothetical protein
MSRLPDPHWSCLRTRALRRSLPLCGALPSCMLSSSFSEARRLLRRAIHGPAFRHDDLPVSRAATGCRLLALSARKLPVRSRPDQATRRTSVFLVSRSESGPSRICPLRRSPGRQGTNRLPLHQIQTDLPSKFITGVDPNLGFLAVHCCCHQHLAAAANSERDCPAPALQRLDREADQRWGQQSPRRKPQSNPDSTPLQPSSASPPKPRKAAASQPTPSAARNVSVTHQA